MVQRRPVCFGHSKSSEKIPRKKTVTKIEEGKGRLRESDDKIGKRGGSSNFFFGNIMNLVFVPGMATNGATRTRRGGERKAERARRAKEKSLGDEVEEADTGSFL